MPTIERCVQKVEPVSPETTGEQLLARFRAEPGVLAIPVVDQGRPLGLVSRDAFLLSASGQFAPALCLARRAADLMDCEPVMVEASLALDALTPGMLGAEAHALLGAFIVTRSGRYHGVASGVSLLQAHNQRLHDAVAEREAVAANAAEDQARQAAAAQDKSRFLIRLGQALRTPLNGVGAVAELLRRQPIGASAQAHVQTITDAADATLRLLQDAIDLARAEAGDLELTPSPCALQPLVDTLQREWGPAAKAADVSLMLSYEGDTELAAEIDGGRLTQVMNGLIANAVDRARHGMVEASLRAVAQQDRVVIQVRVRDDAADPDRADVRLDEAPEEAGLSLAISRLLVSAMGGRLEVGRNRGQGATFHFALDAPRAITEQAEPSNVAELPDLELHAAPHVLIVDDNATNRVVAQALCEMFGCTCETAEDGQEALEAVEGRRFDVILMDIKMPRMDGVAATRAIRALPEPAGATPIIALTANADPDDARRYIEGGMVAVVEKPIKPERLRLAMNTALTAPEVGATDADGAAQVA